MYPCYVYVAWTGRRVALGQHEAGNWQGAGGGGSGASTDCAANSLRTGQKSVLSLTTKCPSLSTDVNTYMALVNGSGQLVLGTVLQEREPEVRWLQK